LFAAVRASDHTFLREYLECGGDANAVDEYDNSLLCIAAGLAKGCPSARRLLHTPSTKQA